MDRRQNLLDESDTDAAEVERNKAIKQAIEMDSDNEVSASFDSPTLLPNSIVRIVASGFLL